MSIAFSAIRHAYDGTAVLHGVDLEVQSGEIMALLGPSGSGKTTLLRLAAGLEPLQQGVIELPGQVVTPDSCPAPERRPTCLVFQQHALFPHLTVYENVAFGLEGLAPDQRKSRVRELLARAGLAGLEARYPHTLSGGQQQRVALARALAPSPAVMLLDEPFASVDVLLVRQLREESRVLLKETGTTTLLVTHDPDDALRLADRIAVIVEGRIVQVGTPRDLWAEPAHPFVAEVLGGRQLLTGRRIGGGVETDFGKIDVSTPDAGEDGAPVQLAIDPRAIDVTPARGQGFRVIDVRFAGRQWLLRIEAGDSVLHAEVEGSHGFAPGDRVELAFAPSGILAYN